MTDSNNTLKKSENNYFIPIVLVLISAIVIIATFYKSQHESLKAANETTISTAVKQKNSTIKPETNPLAKVKNTISAPLKTIPANNTLLSSNHANPNHTAKDNTRHIQTTDRKLSTVKPINPARTSTKQNALQNKPVITKPINSNPANKTTDAHNNTAVFAVTQEKTLTPVTAKSTPIKPVPVTRNINKQAVSSNRLNPDRRYLSNKISPSHAMLRKYMFMHHQPSIHEQRLSAYGAYSNNSAMHPQWYYRHEPQPRFRPQFVPQPNSRFNPQPNPQFSRPFNRLPQRTLQTINRRNWQPHTAAKQQQKMMVQTMERQRLDNDNRIRDSRIRAELEHQIEYLAQMREMQKRVFQHADDNRQRAMLKMQEINSRFWYLQNKVKQLVSKSTLIKPDKKLHR